MNSTLKPCTCHDGELCSNTGFAPPYMCDEILNGQVVRELRCQQGFMILDTPWDPVCYPEPTPSAAEEHRLGIIAKFYR